MKKQEPKLMNLLRMRNILEPHLDRTSRLFHLDHHLAIIRSSRGLLQLIASQHPPFTFDDRRMGIVLHGEAHVNINLVDKQLKAGMLTFIGPGTIINPISFSPDFELCGLAVPADFPLPGPLPQAMNGQVRDFQLPASEADAATTRHILDTLWHVVHQEDYHLPTASSLVNALMCHFDALYRHYNDQRQHVQSRDQTLFDRFIQLVNEHAAREHQIGFYADKMCLTERHLGTVVRQASGVTAKEWIDRAIIARIKVELRHTDKTVAQIADDTCFANPAFFSKFFKRLTGMTPGEYRSK